MSRRAFVAVLTAVALSTAACDGSGGDATSAATTDTTADSRTTGADGASGLGEATGGVTDEPCPDAVDPGRGCIYLGVLSDLSEGPFASFGVPFTDAQVAFWARVNESGGIAGRYEVDLAEHTRDTLFDPAEHRARFRDIEPGILALAQTFGSETTGRIVDGLVARDIVAVPASWTSAWEFQDVVLESGASYCVQSMNALDVLATEAAAPTSVLAVHHPSEYGRDVAAGAKLWADANGATFTAVEQVRADEGGSTAAAVEAIVDAAPDAVVLGVAPTETLAIVVGATEGGYDGRVIAAGPGWNPLLLRTGARDVLGARLWVASPWLPYDADTPGHAAMREWVTRLVGDHAGADAYTAGWVSSYPLLAALEAAAAEGDLTRPSLVDAISTLDDVDYEGMLPPGSGDFTGEPSAQFTRASVVSRVDERVDSGVSPITDGFTTGPTATAARFDAPCTAAAGLG